MNSGLNTVLAHLKSNNVVSVKDALTSILKAPEDVILNNADVIDNLLKYKEPDIVLMTVKLTAECAKSENNRVILTNSSIIKSLLKLFQGSNDEIYHAVRALGNICYDNEKCCNYIGEEGFKSLLCILREYKTYSDVINTAACGLLLNLLSCSQHLGTFYKGDTLMLIEELLKMNLSVDVNSSMVKHLLSALLCVMNNEVEKVGDVNNTRLYSMITDIMKAAVDPEIGVLCLEIFQCNSECSKCDITY